MIPAHVTAFHIDAMQRHASDDAKDRILVSSYPFGRWCEVQLPNDSHRRNSGSHFRKAGFGGKGK
jgi:hypothetical protein